MAVELRNDLVDELRGVDARSRLLAMMPVTERRLDLAGVETSVLEGGDGPPLVLLHGPGNYAASWFQIVPQLARSYRIVVPDLPGHGNSIVPEGAIAADRVLAWLGALVDETCSSPPSVVGQLLGGALATRFAARHSERLSRLVLVDTFGLAPFQPAPEFGRALTAFLTDPSEQTHDGLWRYCAFDLDRLRERMGRTWHEYKTYNLDRARTSLLHATQQSLMEQFGLPAIPAPELERIAVPTTLIWGRHDLATPLSVAETAVASYGWPLCVIENAADDPPVEQPTMFLRVLESVLRGLHA